MDAAGNVTAGFAAYRAVEGIGAEPGEFMKMAMDATRVFLLQAENGLAVGDRLAKARALNAAARIVEFMLGLSGAERGGLSDCLAQVYHYILEAILRGNASNDGEAVAAGRVAVEQLAATWRKVFPDALAQEG